MLSDIHIAAVGDMSGKDAESGESFIRGINIYLSEINENGGINGRKVILDVFDDQNDKDKARKRALEIIDQNRAIAVIGHHYSSCSISAGEVYKEHGIPAISPFSTNVNVTLNNDWYFRNTFNDNLQGRFLANYVHKIFAKKNVCIIHEDLAYGSFLADVFEQTSKSLGIEVKYKFNFAINDSDLDNILQQFVHELKSVDFSGAIFLATHASEGVKLVRLIKDADLENPIVVPDAFASKSFYHGFADLPKEKLNPGYYSNGVYVTSPLLFDCAEEKAQQFKEIYKERYDSDPDWRPAFAYDAIKIVIEAIRNTGVTGSEASITEDRREIKDFLSNLNNIESAVVGVTGFNYFNANGDSEKPISIGVYRNNNTISALTQLRAIRNISEITDLDKAIQDGNVIFVEGRYMYKTDVVYTAVKLNEIIEPKFNDFTCTLDFDLWFRFKGDIKPENIEFMNAIGSIDIGEPVDEQVSEQFTYRRYNVVGEFKTDFFTTPPPYGQHILGINFRHRELTRNNLIFVTDLIGAGLTGGRDPIEKMKQAQVLSPVHGWELDKVRIYQDFVDISTMGSPEFINIPGEIVDYSRFNFGVLVEKDTVGFRRIIPNAKGFLFLVLSIVALFVIYILIRRSKSNFNLQFLWILQTGFVLLLLLSGEAVFVRGMVNKLDRGYLDILQLILDISWWFVPTYMLIVGIERFVWKPLEDKTQQVIPTLMRRLVAAILFILAFFGVVAFVLDYTVTGLLATSGVVAMVIGLALQINISNIFSGIALNMERPFRVGDWIVVDSIEEGRVLDITWRSTRIFTRDENIISIPNSKASDAVIKNYHYPTDEYRVGFKVHVEPHHKPEKILEIINEAGLNTEGNIGKPWTAFIGITDYSAEYWIYILVKDYDDKWNRHSALWLNLMTYLNKSGITPQIRRQEIKMLDSDKQTNQQTSPKKRAQ
ncbi:MAG: ABC transporter substrate-binding protein [Candidatus Hatepunaea meridiana]|nr:ABC transporter substrate-binding protein [Candidatus Hatepunaea meridiana]